MSPMDSALFFAVFQPFAEPLYQRLTTNFSGCKLSGTNETVLILESEYRMCSSSSFIDVGSVGMVTLWSYVGIFFLSLRSFPQANCDADEQEKD